MGKELSPLCAALEREEPTGVLIFKVLTPHLIQRIRTLECHCAVFLNKLS